MKYIVTGRVQPERADISFQEIQMGLDEGAKATVVCGSSQLTVVIDSDKLDGWLSASVLAEDISSVVVSSLGFSLGSGYSVDIIQAIDENHKSYGLGVRPVKPDSSNGEDTLGFGEEYIDVFNRCLRLSGSNIFFRLATRDYMQAINSVKDCATYCYRAIEGIKSSYDLNNDGDGWNAMHSDLGTDREMIESVVKSYADPVRHGNWIASKSTDKYIRWKMLDLTKMILSRYLDVMQKDF